jgi:hypothetical protein
MDFEQEIKILKDTLTVVIEIQRRQAEVQKMQAEGFALHEERMKHIDLRMTEFADKLDGLIGFMDGFFRKQ